MMLAVASAENRPLKRQKLGPPDVYPQDAKQREDELDEVSVRHGFSHRQIQDEYGSALNASITSTKIAYNFNAILKKKADINQLPDTGRKKQQINIKDNFWHATHRSKTNIDAWFKDLAGSKPLTSLAKKVPIFPKREEMLLTLCEYSVPVLRATWFIKMTAFYHESKMAESKIKRRPQTDLSQDWTQTLTRFLKDHLSKISEHYMGGGAAIPGSGSNSSGTTASTGIMGGFGISSSAINTPLPQAPHSSPHHVGVGSTILGSSTGTSNAVSEHLRHWNYCTQLAFYMYQEGLLDRQEFLDWIIDVIVRLRQPEQDTVLRVVLPVALQYLDEITQSEYLARKLSYFAALKIKQMCMESSITSSSGSSNNESSATNPHPSSPATTVASSGAVSSSISTASSQSTVTVSTAITTSGTNSTVVTQSGSSSGGSASNSQNAQQTSNCLGTQGSGANSSFSKTNGGSSSLQELLSCNQHRPVLLSLSCFLQAVTLDCPTALVWNKGIEGITPPWLMGSPLDHLSCPPSDLPMPPRYNNQSVRVQLRALENHIKERSRNAENRWSLDKLTVNVTSSTITRVLAALEALDTHCFSRVDISNSIDTLYSKIFTLNKSTSSGSSKDGNADNASSANINQGSNQSGSSPSGNTNPMHNNSSSKAGSLNSPNEDAIVRTLCEWAVSAQRSGEHRALVVARLLEKRQNDLILDVEDKDGVSLPFQDLLLKFLDTQAPVFDENALSVRTQEFGNLVLLFSELIRQDVFSHDSYMCYLISRGDLASNNHINLSEKKDGHERKEDGVDNIEDDIDKILQNIANKEADAPDSPKDDVNTSLEEQSGGTRGERGPGGKHRTPRHLIYAQHFPLPSDDAYNHEINQRYVLLYGVGKARDEARHSVKKLSKEIQKLFSKKFSKDIAEGGKVKRSSRGEINFETILNRFKSLSYFDQHVITNQVASQVLEMLSGVATGSSNYLPVLEHISFLMDIMEIALNIQGLLDFSTQIIKEILDIESQLVERQCLVESYCPKLTLHVVGFLRKYHCCLLVSQEQTTSIFEGLCRLVKHVSNPSDCTSPERVVLAHLHDLYTSCSFLKSKHHESFSNANPKIKQTLYAQVSPSKGSFRWSPTFMEEYIKNPNLKIDNNIIKQLNEPANRYSFVWSAIIEACSVASNDKLNDMAILCANLTARCNALSSDWLHALNTLCCSSEKSPGYNEVLSRIDLTDPRSSPTIHSSLSVFTAILIARHCFTLPNFLNHVVFQSLKAAWNNGNGNPEAEPGASLTCHLLLRIFKSVESPQPSQYGAGSPQNVPTAIDRRSIKMNCDRNLLAAAAHLSLTMAPVLAVLKAMLIVSDAMSGQSKSQASISDILGTSDAGNGSNDSDMLGKGADKACLADFARYALRQICSQEWVRECCLKSPKELCGKDHLLDSIFSSKQALRLLHLICHPDSPSSHSDSSLDHRTILANILEDLDEWTLRISWLDLKLMYEQHRGVPPSQQSQMELNIWLDNVAQAVINVFQQNTDSDHKQKNQKSRSISLVAPLIAKLPKAVQGRVLKVAGEFLNSVNFGAFSTSKVINGSAPPQMTLRVTGGSNSSSTPPAVPQQVQPPVVNVKQWPLSSHRPFLQLVLMCLEGQEDQLQSILDSLKDQLNQAVTLYKEEKSRPLDDNQCRQQVLEALKLRFALVGSLFDTIINSGSSSLICEWAQLLVNLTIHGVIDLTNNSELFTTVLDMLAALIHSSLTTETNSESREENRRNYTMVVKKVKKELVDHKNVSLRLVRQLTPFPKVHTEVVTLELWGTITDSKGNRVQDFEKDKKHGLQVAEKQKLSPWDLLDGHRNPAPLSWVWFATTRLERKPLKYEESHKLQRFHSHSMVKPMSYFLEPPPLPPEDLEPIPDKSLPLGDMPMKEEVRAPDTPSSDQSPRGTKRVGGKTKNNRNKRPKQPSMPQMGNPNMPSMPYQNSNFNTNPQGGQWPAPNNFPQQHQPTQPQPTPQQTGPYCTQQLPPGKFNTGGAPCFGPSSNAQGGRIAIKQYLVQRKPGTMGGMGGQPTQGGMGMGSMPMTRPQMVRTPLRGPGMYGGAGTGSMQGGPMTSQGMPSQMYPSSVGGQGNPQSSMGQYSNYPQSSMGAGQMMGTGPQGGPSGGPNTGGVMMGQNYAQGGYQNSNMMMRQQPYMASGMNQTGQMVQRPQYMQGNSSMGMMSSTGQNYSARPGMTQGTSNTMMRQRMMMTASASGNQASGAAPPNSSMMNHMQRGGAVPQQQQNQNPQGGGQQNTNPQQNPQGQQSIIGSQGMGYPGPPPY